MEIRYKQLLTSPILLLMLLIVAQSAEKLQQQQQQSQEESSFETSETERLKRASGKNENSNNSDGGIIIDVNNGDYPNENYYYDNYDFSNSNNNENNGVERPSTSFNLNNTYKVESHVINDDNEDVVDDSGDAVVHIESGSSGKKKTSVPPFIPNESDDSGAAGVRIMDPIDEDDDGDDTYGGADDEGDAGIIKIDSPPQFKPSHQQTFNTDKTAHVNLNNNRASPKSSDLTTKSTSQQRLINLKYFVFSIYHIRKGIKYGILNESIFIYLIG